MRFLAVLPLFALPCNSAELKAEDCAAWFQGKHVKRKLSFDSFNKETADSALNLLNILVTTSKPDQSFPQNSFWQANVIIKGYLLKRQYNSAKDSIAFLDEFKEDFCSFWSVNAYGP